MWGKGCTDLPGISSSVPVSFSGAFALWTSVKWQGKGQSWPWQSCGFYEVHTLPARRVQLGAKGSICAKQCSAGFLLCLCLHSHGLAMPHMPLPGFPAAAGDLLGQERCCVGWKADLNKTFTLGHTCFMVSMGETALLKCCHEWEKEVVCLRSLLHNPENTNTAISRIRLFVDLHDLKAA